MNAPLPEFLSVLLARLDGIRIGFPATSVHEIIRAVAIDPLPGTSSIIEGVINLHGRIVPVVDLRQRLALPELPLAPDQFLIVLQSIERLIAVRVDDVEDVMVVGTGSIQPPTSVSPVVQRLQGVAAVSDGALVIYDVDAFLSQSETDALNLVELQTA